MDRRLTWAPWLLLAAAICLQAQAGLALLPADLLSADPPAHFTTGVMLHDYLRNAGAQQPIPFAECFYIRYPKVAFGHWPPLFYILEAAWFFVFGARIVAARWLCVAITLCCATAIYRRCRGDWDRWHAMAAAALFLALPIVRHQAWNIMSDLLLTLVTFLALCSLSDYLTQEKGKDALWLAVWGGLAILTKGTGWLLLGPIVAGPLITGRPRVYFRWSYWFAVLATCAIAAPFYIWVSRFSLGYPAIDQIHRAAGSLRGKSPQVWMAVGSGVIIAAFAVYRLLPRKPLKPAPSRVVIMAVWGLTLTGFLTLAPLTPEVTRYYMVLLAPLAYVFSGAMAALDRFSWGRLAALLIYAGLLTACVPIRFVATSAFSRAIAAIPVTRDGAVILVESDSSGEGAVIAAELERNQYRSSYVLRGSHLLSVSSWSGYNYVLKYDTPAAVGAALETADPDYIVFDASARPTPDSRLLQTVLQEPGGHWQIAFQLPVPLSGRKGDILIYRREQRVRATNLPTTAQLGPESGSRTFTCHAR